MTRPTENVVDQCGLPFLGIVVLCRRGEVTGEEFVEWYLVSQLRGDKKLSLARSNED